MWSVGGEDNAMQRDKKTHRRIGKTAMKNGERDWRYAAINQGTPVSEAVRIFPSPVGAWPCQHFNFGLLISITEIINLLF